MNILHRTRLIVTLFCLFCGSSCLSTESFYARSQVVQSNLNQALASAMGLKPEELTDPTRLAAVAPIGQTAAKAKQWLDGLVVKIPKDFKHRIIENNEELALDVFVEDESARWEIITHLVLDAEGKVSEILVHHALWGK